MTLKERIERDAELKLEIIELQTRRRLVNDKSDIYMTEDNFDGYAKYRNTSNQISEQIDAKTIEMQKLWN